MKTILILSLTILTSCVSTQSTYRPQAQPYAPSYTFTHTQEPTSYHVTPDGSGGSYIKPY